MNKAINKKKEIWAGWRGIYHRAFCGFLIALFLCCFLFATLLHKQIAGALECLAAFSFLIEFYGLRLYIVPY